MSQEVISIELIGYTSDNEYVYDIETEDGTYYAGLIENKKQNNVHYVSQIDDILAILDKKFEGIEGILLKNTDSCYVTFNISKDDYLKINENTNKEEFDEVSYMKDMFKIAQECADNITAHYKHPIELEFEKFMYPFFLYEKKRYAYQEWTKPEKPKDSLEFKGLSLKRRDSCGYVKEVCTRIVDILMKEISEDKKTRGNIVKAIEYTKESISNLFENKVPMEKLILSNLLTNEYKYDGKTINWMKPLKKNNIIQKDKNGNIKYDPNIYKIPRPHLQVAIRLREKDPINYPKSGDRVDYVYIYNKDAKLASECAMHPSEINPTKNKIDTLYYAEHQLINPILTLFKGIVSETEIINTYNECKKIALNKLNNQTSLTNFFQKVNNNNNNNNDNTKNITTPLIEINEDLDDENNEEDLDM